MTHRGEYPGFADLILKSSLIFPDLVDDDSGGVPADANPYPRIND